MESNATTNYKRNFLLGIGNGTLVNFGMAFVDPFTVIPVFIARLGGSSLVIGLVSALYGAGWFLPQVFVSRIVESRRHVLGIYRNMAVLRIATMAAAAMTVFLVSPQRPMLFLSLLIGSLLLTNIGAGVAAIPFLEVTSRTIPTTQRGRFFGLRRFSGGLLGIGAGAFVAIILNENAAAAKSTTWLAAILQGTADRLGLSGHDFPLNYGVLFLLGGFFISIGILLFCFVAEAPAKIVHKPSRLLEHLTTGFSIMRRDANYRLFYLVRICWQFSAMAFPFYSTFAVGELGFSESTVGVFVSLWVGSGVISNYIWGRILDRKGNKLVLIVTAGLSILPPVTGFILAHLHAGGYSIGSSSFVFVAIASTFFINGLIRSGRFISNITYLLEVAPADKRPLYVGFMNSFTFPLMLSPALGGLILTLAGIRVLFLSSICFAVANLVLSSRLREPRATIMTGLPDN
jgi:MFS family permease